MKEKWIQEALPKASKGKLHAKLGIAKDKKIPKAVLKSKEHAKGKLGKEVRLAESLAKMKKK
jgi:hypothetical protein